MAKLEIREEYSHDTREGWACVSWWLGDVLVAENDGSHTTIHAPEYKEAIEEYWEENGKSDPDWEAYDDALLIDQAAQIREDHGDDWVILHNGYEQETSRGFANTYSIDDAEEGDTSTHGWFEAEQVKDIGEEFNAELVAWATAKGLDTVKYWF